MIKDTSKIEPYRRPHPFAGLGPIGHPTGAFAIPTEGGWNLQIIASEGFEEVPWEHVSVCCRRGQDKFRLPNYNEMCAVKQLFWLPEETVMQLHVPESEHINVHDFVLHLWRPLAVEIPRPPVFCV